MAKQDVLVPDLGGASAVDVIDVLVKAGDTVNVEDSLLTLESEKATMDLPSPYAGTVSEVKVSVGDKVSEGSLVLSLDVSEAAGEPAEAAAPQAEESVEPEAVAAAPETPVSAPAVSEPAAPRPAPPAPEPTPGAKPYASPSVRRFARQLGVDLSKVAGSGRNQRILREDVEAYVKKRMQRGEGGFGLPEREEIDFSRFGEVSTRPLSKIQRLSGENLHRSWLTVPHVTQFDEADITELEAFRKQLNRENEKEGIKFTYLPFLMRAVVAALKAYPRFNSSLDAGGENLILKHYFHIGVAVDTPDGLMVPVIRDVDSKGLLDIAVELKEVSERARKRQIKPGELQGASFTITSLGGIGGTAFTPIVNAPEVAILGVSRATMKPVYVDDSFVPRLMMPLSLSYDHRVIDGADAARFCAHLTAGLADLRRALL